MDKGEKKKGRAAAPGNEKTYAREIRLMELRGEKFAVNQFGKVSVGAFADRCGFGRSVLEGKGALAERFAADVERLGIATADDAPTANDVPRLRQKADDRQKLASDLQKQLDLKTAEAELFRLKAEELTEQVRELQLGRIDRNRTLEHMLATGERFFL